MTMKKNLVAAVVASVFVLAASAAQAGFYCRVTSSECQNSDDFKNKPVCSVRTGTSYANEHTLEWHWQDTFPNTDPFHYETKNVLCFADGYVLYNLLPQLTGFPHVAPLQNGTTQGPGSGAKVGVIYRGDDARFLIDNLRSVPYGSDGWANSGNPGTNLAGSNAFKP